MAITLSEKTLGRLIQKSTLEYSVLAGALSTEYEFTGVKTVKIVTAVSQPYSDYKRDGTNRYGDPKELQDTVQEMTLTQDKGFSMTIDKGNFKDQQHIKKAKAAIKMQQREQGVPMKDEYKLGQLARKAGTVVGNATALTKSTIVDRIMEAGVELDNAEIPQENRTLFITAGGYKMLKLSDEFEKVEAIAKRSLSKGTVGYFDNMRVVKVPKGRWPENVNFIIVQKNSATAPDKIHEVKCHKDPPGISGSLIEGREYYDCFVIGTRAKGVYAEINTASGAGTVVAVPTINATTGAITVASGASAKYTTDGSDPRYSTTAVVGVAPAGVKAGMKIRAYAFKEGSFDSGVTEVTITAAT